MAQEAHSLAIDGIIEDLRLQSFKFVVALEGCQQQAFHGLHDNLDRKDELDRLHDLSLKEGKFPAPVDAAGGVGLVIGFETAFDNLVYWSA